MSNKMKISVNMRLFDEDTNIHFIMYRVHLIFLLKFISLNEQSKWKFIYVYVHCTAHYTIYRNTMKCFTIQLNKQRNKSNVILTLLHLKNKSVQ